MSRLWLLLVVVLMACTAARAEMDICHLRHVRGCGTPAGVDGPFMCQCRILQNDIIATTYTDVVRLKDSYVFLLEMPGVKTATVQVEYVEEVGGHILSIRGLSRYEDGFDNFERRRYGRQDRGGVPMLFGRKFILPRHADIENISHELSHGLLKVTVPISGMFESEDVSTMDTRATSTGYMLRRLPELECTIERADELITLDPIVAPLPECSVGASATTSIAFMDSAEFKDSYVFIFEMPGVQTAKIDGTGGLLNVTGVVHDEAYEQALRLDRGASRTKIFAHPLRPPKGCDLENASHQFSGNGLLKVTVPKVPPTLWEIIRLNFMWLRGSSEDRDWLLNKDIAVERWTKKISKYFQY